MGLSGEFCAGSGRIDNSLSGRYGHLVEPGLGAAPTFHTSFLLCNSCYWCATEIGGMGIRKCPACKHAVEPLPIAAGELFKFNYDQKRGVHLAFRRG